MISPRWPTSWWLRWTPIALFSTRGPCEAISSTRPGSSVSGWVIFAANGDSNDFSGLAGHPSHDGWPHSPWRLRRDDPQGEEAKLLLLKCSYVEIVENSFLERAIHIFMRPWPTKTMTGPLVICWLLLPGLQHQHVFMDRFWISSRRFWTSTKCPWINALVSVESENIYILMEGPPSFISIFQSTSREYIEYLDLKSCIRLWKMVFQCGPSWREGSHRCISSSLSILDD